MVKSNQFLNCLQSRNNISIVIARKKAKSFWTSAFLPLTFFLAGVDSFRSLWVVALIVSFWWQLALASIHFSRAERQHFCLFQEGCSCKGSCKRRHMEGGLYSAFCHGDQTFHRGRNVLFLKFCMLSKRNQDLLLHHENSRNPIA